MSAPKVVVTDLFPIVQKVQDELLHYLKDLNEIMGVMSWMSSNINALAGLGVTTFRYRTQDQLVADAQSRLVQSAPLIGGNFRHAFGINADKFFGDDGNYGEFTDFLKLTSSFSTGDLFKSLDRIISAYNSNKDNLNANCYNYTIWMKDNLSDIMMSAEDYMNNIDKTDPTYEKKWDVYGNAIIGNYAYYTNRVFFMKNIGNLIFAFSNYISNI
jgi:hypothetical protein